jgi:hypothetical protein
VRDTTSRGELSELEIATALARAGRIVLRPLSSGLRYDLAIDNGDGTLTRIQCKTGVLKDGAVHFRAYNADARRPKGVRYWGQIEAFAVFCPQTRGVYLVPITALVSGSTARLRIGVARNGQRRRVRNASDFEIGAR